MPEGGTACWTREDCVNALKELACALGGLRPTVADVQRRASEDKSFPPVTVIRELFGGLSAAVAAAGLSSLPTRKEFELDRAVRETRECFERRLEERCFLLWGEKERLVWEARAFAGFIIVLRENWLGVIKWNRLS